MKWLLVMAGVLLVPLARAGEIESLRERCAEQERQIRDLETEVGRLRSELQQRANEGVIPVGTGEVLDIRRADAEGKIGAVAAKNLYTVKKGDTLTSIARHFGTTVEVIAKENSITHPSRLAIGDKLEIPRQSKAAAPPKQTVVAPPPAATGKTYKVKKGDTLYGIAKSQHTTTEALAKANPKLDPSRLRIGQVIRLANAPASTAAAQAGPPAPPKTAKPPAPKPAKQPAAQPAAAPAEEPAIRLVRLSEKITFGDFAAKHNATVEQLNEMNGQSLAASTLLDAGSELYVPIQP